MEWTDIWTGWTYGWTDGKTDISTGRTDGLNGQTDKRIDGRTDRHTDWTDGGMECIHITYFTVTPLKGFSVTRQILIGPFSSFGISSFS